MDENANDLDLRKERNASSLRKNSLGLETNNNNTNGNGEEGGGPISPTSIMDATQSMTADTHSDVLSLPSVIDMSQSQKSLEAVDTDAKMPKPINDDYYDEDDTFISMMMKT